MKVTDRTIAVLGFYDSGAGQVDSWYEEATGLRIGCFIHDSDVPWAFEKTAQDLAAISPRVEFPRNGEFKGRPFFCETGWPRRLRSLGINKVLPLVSNNMERLKQIQKALDNGFEVLSAIHPTALLFPEVVLGVGCWINARSLVGYRSLVGDGVIINVNANVSHHNTLGAGCEISDGVVMAGHVNIERRASVFSNATIIPKIRIGENAIIGAGSVVISDIPANATAVGVPAKVIKIAGKNVGADTSTKT